MSTAELLERLKDARISLAVDGESLIVKADKGLITEELRSSLQENKKELIAILKTGRLTTQNAIGEVSIAPPAIQPDSTVITPEMLLLIELTQEEIDEIVDCVPGGIPNIQDIYALSPLQDGILFHHLMASEGDPYVISNEMAFTERGLLDRFLSAVQQVVDRHDILRTAFIWRGLSQPAQVVWRQAQLSVTELKLDPRQGPIAEQLLQHFDHREHRIDLSRPPLLRYLIAHDPDHNRWVLLQSFHHLVGDHSTLDVLGAEVEAVLAGQGHTLAVPQPFRNLVAQARLGVSREEHERFFQQMLGDVTEPTLPFGLSDVYQNGGDLTELRRILPQTLNDRLRAQARRIGVSLASLCHLAWGLVLARSSGSEPVVFGTVLLGRMQAGGANKAAGLFTNTLPLRLDLDGRGTETAARQTHANMAELLVHEHASLALAQRCSGVAPPSPLFSAILNYRHNPVDAPPPAAGKSTNSLAGIEFLGGNERTNYPLTMSVEDYGQSLGLTALVVPPLAERMCSYMQQALESVAQALETDPQIPVRQLEILPPDERTLLLEEWNATEAEYPEHSCIHELFEEQVRRTPEAIAVVCEEEWLSYEELNQQANRLGHYLMGLGVKGEERVGMCVERGLGMVVGLMGILKAGGAYVPLDPGYPGQRLREIVEDAGPRIVLSDAGGREALGEEWLEGIRNVSLDQVGQRIAEARGGEWGLEWAGQATTNPETKQRGLNARSLAYVIYTSGSTGEPKGVMVEHGSVVNFLCSMAERPGIRCEDRWLAVTSISFDIAGLELYLPLSKGAGVVLARRNDVVDPHAVQRSLAMHGISMMQATPATWRGLLEAKWKKSLELVVLCGGEAMPGDLASRLSEPGGAVWNMYGPTETTIWSSCSEVRSRSRSRSAGDKFSSPSIGRPIANTKMYVLDGEERPVPLGAVGEIYIGGAGVARGYLRRPEVTAERFVGDPFTRAAGARMYRTGDLGRYLPDGNIEFLGRNDQQVKIRGFRIELGEIEARLREHEWVREAAVVAREDEKGEKRLVAYVVVGQEKEGEGGEGGRGQGEVIDKGSVAGVLRRYLGERVPEYMVPAAYVRLEEMPLTPNGKLDRKGLLAPEGEAYAQRKYEGVEGEIEEALAGMWQELLGVERVGREDHFFELGGHSLLAVRLQARIWKVFGVELAMSVLFARPMLAQLTEAVREAGAEGKREGQEPIERISREGGMALSFAQQRLWFLAQLEPESAAYNIPFAFRLRGDLDGPALRRTLDALFARHESLRSIFVAVDGQPHVELLPVEIGLSLVEEDLRGVDDRRERVMQLSREEAWRPFHLSRGPLVRARLIQLEEQEYVFLLTQHHIVSDQWSMGIFVREIGELYRAFSQGRPDPLPPLSIQYPDYAAWQRGWLSRERLERQSQYWRETLADAPVLLDLPTDRLRPPRQSFAGTGVPIHIDRELTRGLKELSSRYDATLFMTLLSAWAAVLSRLSGQEDLIIGVPTANRARPETEGLIGFFVNTLALRVELRNEPSVAELLGRVRATALAAQDHRDLPFEQVVEIVQPLRRLNHTPLFQVMLLWQNDEAALPELPRVAVEPAGMSYGAVKFDLELVLSEQGETIVGRLKYATALFDEATIQRQGGYLLTMLKAMVANSQQRLGDIELLAAEERMLLLEEWNATEAEYPEHTCIHELFEEQVRKTPDAAAVVFEEATLTYAELNRRANQQAHCLRELGVKPDGRVAICLERGLEMIVAILAVVKAGAAYVPLDPAYPVERLRWMLQDTAPAVLLTQRYLQDQLARIVPEALPILDLSAAAGWLEEPETNPDREAVGLNSRHLAYVIYTSGSTGTPKGVMVEHRSINRLVINAGYAKFEASDRVAFASNPTFDVTTMEIWAPLLNGGRIVVIAQGVVLDPVRFRKELKQQGVSILWLTVGLFNQYAEGLKDEISGLRYLIVGGDALDARAVRKVLGSRPPEHLINGYGPTETTTFAATHEIKEVAEDARSVPIGRPIANTRIYILDGQKRPVPVGVAGELYIGGAGVARGYWNRAEPTAERFVPDRFSQEPGSRLYMTGDVCRWRADGNIEFLGRNDHQVKIRGYRIELGEIEARLLACAGVREAVVAVGEERAGEKRLVAYVVAEEGMEVGMAQLRSELSETLPEYMVPSAYVRLERMPLTSNGKLDRRALPAPEGDIYARPSYEEPLTEMELILAEVWQELLGVERVGRNDNFFELGGHSLLAVRLVQRLRRLDLQVEVRSLFATPVLSDLASVLGQHRDVPIPPNVITPETRVITPEMLPLIDLTQEDIDRIVEQVPGGVANIQDIYALAPLQEGILFHYLAETEGDAYLLSTLMAFPERALVDLFLTAVQQAVLRHDILRTCIHWQELTQPAQVVLRQAEISVTEVELDPANGPIPEQLSLRFDRRHRIDLTQAPLLHFAVSQDPETHCWVVLQRSHHLIGDHSTLDVLRAEVSTLASGQGSRLGRPQPFRSLVAQARLGTKQEEHERFFRQMLGEVTEPTLPFALANVLRNGEDITETRRRLPQELNDRLRVHARRLGVSLASLCHLAWGQVLARTSGSECVVFGTVLLGRMVGGEGADQAVGLFINTLPVRLDLDGTGTENAVRQAHARLAELLVHEHASLALAQRCSGVEAPAPLFSALLNYRHNQAPAVAIEADAERVNPLAGIKFLRSEERTNYPVTLSVEDNGQSLGVTALVERSLSGERICSYMQQALESLAQALETAPSAPVRQLEILPPEERALLLESWNATDAADQEDVCIHQLFEEQVEKTPAGRAVECEGETLSYEELNERSNRLAHYLIGLGVKPDDRVGICVERGVGMVVGLLGILKAGGAYVPLDPSYPMERLRYILEDSSPSVLLTQANLRSLFPAIQERLSVLDLDDGSAWRECTRTNPDPKRLGLVHHHLAYVIYTSGSTGMPKGVMVEHAQVTRLFRTTECNYGFNDQDVWCLFHSMAFDFSVWELWGALAYGGRLVIVPRDVARSGRDFYRLVCDQGVTVLNQTPSAFQGFIQAEAEGKLQHRLRYVVFGGEALEPSVLKPWYSRHADRNPQLVNMYGITETTVHVTYRPLQLSDCMKSGSPVGKRLADLRIYLLDQQGEPVPLGAVGEIYVGGAGVARGYLNRPDLTKERFLKDPFCSHPGARMYKTGDLARYLPDGDMEFLGRNDQQVKIRGFRIELGEIETRLMEHPLVREAVVIAREDGGEEKRLVAYLVANVVEEGEPGPVPPLATSSSDLAVALRAHLAGRLPEYMVPSAYVRLERMPLTANGKLDRRALPAPEGDVYARHSYEEPLTEMEQILAEVWQELLGVERVGRQDNFFELGGHSLLAVHLMERLRRLKLQVEVRTLFATPVLSDLASVLGQHRDVPIPPNVITPETRVITPDMLPLIDLTQEDIDRIVEQVPGGVANIQDIYALAPLQEGILFHHLVASEGDPYVVKTLMEFPNKDLLHRFLSAVQNGINRHDILRTAFVWEGLSQAAQVVLRQVEISVTEVELDPADGPITEQLSGRFDQRHYRMDVTRAPLLHYVIAQEPGTPRWILVQLEHHLTEDAFSGRIFRSEARAFMEGKEAALPPPSPFRNLLAQVRFGIPQEEHERFFRRVLGEITEPTLPFGLLDVNQDGEGFTETTRTLSQELNDRLRAQARRLGVSLATLCHLAWGQVLARCSGVERVVFGTVLFGRMLVDGASEAGGLFLNTLPLRLDLDGTRTEAAVRQTHARLAELLVHEHASLALAQRCSGIVAPYPLFSAILNYRHKSVPSAVTEANAESVLAGVKVLGSEERSNYPVTLSVEDYRQSLGLTALVERSLAGERVCGYMQQALESLAQALETAPSTPVRQLEILPPEERTLLLETWNATEKEYPEQVCIHKLFEEQVSKTPDGVAVTCGEESLSYGQLNRNANRLAHYLIDVGVKPDDRAAVCVERGLGMVVGLLGILKAGGAYVPLDPSYPSQRLLQILRDAGPKLLLSDAAGRKVLGEAVLGEKMVVDFDQAGPAWMQMPDANPDTEALGLTSQHLAYVIYTSGSTGKPKGVMIKHDCVVNFLISMSLEPGITAQDRLLAVTSISFDIAGLELYLPLSHGAQIVVARHRDSLDPHELQGLMQEHRITMMQATPAIWRPLLDAQWKPPAGLKILCGGEALPADLAARLAEQGKSLWNLYGPTETTIWSACVEIERGGGDATVYASIGRPIENTQIYLLDEQGQPVPLGAVGEIYIGGVGVARGYLDRAEMTAERFVPDSFTAVAGTRMYKTGDLARYLADGNIEFLGRNDQQVKIRGYRIELGEIEARLAEYPGVREAVVIAREDVPGDKRLVGYLVPQPLDEFSHAHSSATGTTFSLFYFGADSGAAENKYELYLKSAKFADENHFEAVWTPERHFHNVGQLYPNPATLSAALSTITTNIKLRAGSVVLPLHDPIRVAEEWAIVDNLSNGRVGIAAASGWHPRDFSLIPQNYSRRRQAMQESIQALQTLWRGETITRLDGNGKETSIRIFPEAIQPELPLWITAAGRPETFAYAGKIGANVLTHLLGQTISELGQQIAQYRAARAEAGYEPESGRVTLMIHAFLGEDLRETLSHAKAPFMRYMQEHLGLREAWAKSLGINIDELLDQDKNIAEFAFERYTRTASLIGTPQACLSVANQLQGIGVNEIACLIDWMDADNALKGLPYLKQLYDLTRASFNRDSLRTYLSSRLPEYMVPAAFVQLEALPLTPNGKLDRKALPAPEAEAYAQRIYEPPQGETEKVLANLWQEVLGLERVGRHDHFFELGGHSLLAMRLQSRIWKVFGVELPMGTVFASPTLTQLAEALTKASISGKQDSLPSITPVSRGGALPLSFAQQRLWFIDQLHPNSSAYNTPYAMRIKGVLNVDATREALSEIVKRHEVLRTTFIQTQEGPVQVVQRGTDFRLEVEDLCGVALEEREAEMLQRVQAEADQPFDLEHGPVMRARILHLGKEDHVLQVVIHHIVTDGWSEHILLREFASLYAAFAMGQPSPLAEMNLQYGDFAVSQRQWLKGEVLAGQVEYWKKELHGMHFLDLPVDGRRTGVGQRAGKVSFRLTTEATENIKQLSISHHATVFMVLTAAFHLLLGWYADQEDVVTGTDVANRNWKEVESMIGFFVNQLVLRTDLSGDPAFSELLRRVRTTTLGAYTHQDVPFEKVVEELAPTRIGDQLPLFNVKMIMLNTPEAEISLPGLQIETIPMAASAPEYLLAFKFAERAEALHGWLEYPREMFRDSTIELFLLLFRQILDLAVANPSIRLNAIREQLHRMKESHQQQRKVSLQTELDRRFSSAKRAKVAVS